MSSSRNEQLVNAVVPFHLEPQENVVRDDLGVATDSYFTQIYPQDGGNYSGEGMNVITFHLDSSHCALDLSRSTIEYNLMSTSGTAKLDGDAHSAFSRVRLMTKGGSVILEQRDFYNLQHAMEQVVSV